MPSSRNESEPFTPDDSSYTWLSQYSSMPDGTNVLSKIRRDLNAITDPDTKGVMEDIWLKVITSFNGRSTSTPNKTHDLGSIVSGEINTLGAAITLGRRKLGLQTTPSTGGGSSGGGQDSGGQE
ncbi:hypothetical protein JCM24511_03657 [Saitozyma sp. JCM 24511]|nr:hypothetical protein JCM24511_03657 [Saitozyma sp. JCM 24511]